MANEPEWLLYGPDEPATVICEQCGEVVATKYIETINDRVVCQWCIGFHDLREEE